MRGGDEPRMFRYGVARGLETSVGNFRQDIICLTTIFS